MLRFDLLRTPRQDGDVLIEPAASRWAELIEQNVRGRIESDSAVRLAGISMEEVRHATRERLFGRGRAEAVIACGHQPGFAHPGVWAKHVMVRHMASQLGLHGTDLVVDNDAPRSTALILPEVSPSGHVSKHLIQVLGGITGAAYEARPSLSPTAIDMMQRQTAGVLAGVDLPDGGRLSDRSMIFQYLRGLASVERPRDFVEQHLAGRGRIDRLFAADLQELRVSDTFDGPFVADILLNLERFAREYNASLADYRRDQHVRSPERPLPDLKRTGDRMEAPFWIYHPLQQRRRLWIAARQDAIEIFAGHEPAGMLSRLDLARNAPAALASLAPWVIRPRALTLTLWARLLVCDLFVHGIGGAKYDRVNDGIFHRYYRCEPPPYACVTATLRLPLPHFAVSRQDLLEARRKIRDLRFNPQRYSDRLPTGLLNEREQLIGQSVELRTRRAPATQRRDVFHGIRNLNDQLNALMPGLPGRFEVERDEIARGLQSDRLADSREFFYALQPRNRLEMLASRLRETARMPGASPVQR